VTRGWPVWTVLGDACSLRFAPILQIPVREVGGEAESRVAEAVAPQALRPRRQQRLEHLEDANHQNIGNGEHIQHRMRTRLETIRCRKC